MRDELEVLFNIDLYLRGELRGDKLIAFEEQIKSDPSLLTEIELQKSVNFLVHGVAYQDIRRKMRADLKQIDSRKKILKKSIIVTISVLLLIVVGYFSFLNNNKKSEVKINISSYEVDNSILKSKENSENIKDEVKPDTTSQIYVNNSSRLPSKKIVEKESFVPVKPFNLENKSKDKNEKPINHTFNSKNEISNVLPDQKILTDSINVAFKSENHKIEGVENKSSLNKINCKEINIIATPIIEASCYLQANGKISFVNHISGGFGPYQVSIENDQNFSDKAIFEGLGAGKYVFFIRDIYGCTSKSIIAVSEKECNQNKFIINTTIGETWNVPAANSDFALRIYNKSGREIFRKNFNGFVSKEWRGEDNNGVILDSGIYIYVIEYSDGKIENGQISIVK